MKKRSNKRNSFLPILTIVFSALFMFAGCGSSGGGGGSAGSGTTSVSISMTTPSSSASASTAGGVSAQASAPKIITSIVIEISGDGMSTISRTIAVAPGVTYTETFDVPNGENRVFNARAYMSDGTLLYEAVPQTVNLDGTSVPISLHMVLADVEKALNLAMAALESGDIITARDLFRAAVGKYDGVSSASYTAADITENGSEIAHFFYSFTRVLAMFFETESDGVDDGLNDAGDILDFLECEPNGRDPFNFDLDCPETLNKKYNGQDAKNFMQNVIAEVEGAIGNLADGKVTSGFNFRWKEPFGGEAVESDYGDALVLRAVFKAAMAAYKIGDAYDPEVNIPVGIDLDTFTLSDFLNMNNTFPSMTGQGKPSESVIWQRGALADIEGALNEIERELDADPDQSDDWFTVDETEIDKAIEEILPRIKACYKEDSDDEYLECQVAGFDTTSDLDDTKMDFGPYFRDDVHVNTLWPEFTGDDPTGKFPDSSFRGMFTKISGSDPDVLDADADEDGNADIFQSKLNYVYAGTVEGEIDYDNACEDPVGYYNFDLKGAKVTVNDEAIFDGSVTYDFYVIKFEPKDFGFFSDLVDPDIYLDAIEFLDVASSSYLNTPWTNFDDHDISGNEDRRYNFMNSKRHCIIVDNRELKADKVKVHGY